MGDGDLLKMRIYEAAILKMGSSEKGEKEIVEWLCKQRISPKPQRHVLAMSTINTSHEHSMFWLYSPKVEVRGWCRVSANVRTFIRVTDHKSVTLKCDFPDLNTTLELPMCTTRELQYDPSSYSLSTPSQ